MRAHEFVSERKRIKRRPRWAAYGPGPYGGYGYAVGYSGDGGGAGGDGGVGEDAMRDVIYTKPNLENEWEEAARYPEFVRIGKEAWLKLAKAGKAVTITSAKDIDNTDAADPDSFKLLNRDKQARALSQIKQGNVEMPIVAVYPDGRKELIAGNTRLTATLAKYGKSTLWAFKVPNEVARLTENFADGKKPGRKGLAKRSGVNTKASVSDLRKTAKNSTGEKARMAHWLANMKAGRAKKEDVDEGQKDYNLDDIQDITANLEKEFTRLQTFYYIVDINTGKKLRMFDAFDTLDDAKEIQNEYGLTQKTKIVKRVYKNRSQYDSNVVDEGWKDWVAGAAIGAASLGAAGDADASVKKDLNKPAIQQVVKKKEIKPIAPPKATEKELATSVTGNSHEVYLRKAAEKAGIKGQELVSFLSQCAHETMDFKHMKEIGGSLDFRKYDPKYSPKKAKALGNKQVGDGAKYKGRGYIQLTGRDNYKRAGQALGLPLEKQPELVEKPEIAAKVAVWYWNSRVASKVDNFKNTADVTKTINPGMKHLDQRKEKQQSFQVAMR